MELSLVCKLETFLTPLEKGVLFDNFHVKGVPKIRDMCRKGVYFDNVQKRERGVLFESLRLATKKILSGPPGTSSRFMQLNLASFTSHHNPFCHQLSGSPVLSANFQH